MEIIHDDDNLRRYMDAAEGGSPILIDQFLENALECEADALSDGVEAFVPAVLEHVEYAGIHSGDSAAMIPSVTIPAEHLATIKGLHAPDCRGTWGGWPDQCSVRDLRWRGL